MDDNGASSSKMTRASGQSASSSSTRRAIPWLAVFALAMGMLVYGVAESYGPVVAVTSLIPSQYYYLSLSVAFIAGGFGALLAGYLTDKIGRKNSFLIVAAMVLIGTAIFLAAPTYAPAVILSFILVGMAAIGMETPILTALSEFIPPKYRGNLLTIVQNFGNIGVAIVFIPAIIGLSAAQDTVAYALLLIAPLIALVLGYWFVTESRPWQAVTGKEAADVKEVWKEVEKEEAEPVQPTAGMGFRYFFITLIGIVQDVAFVWITYDIGYLYFTDYSSLIPLVGGITMAIVGIIVGVFFVHRLSRRSFSIVSYGLLVLLWALLWGYVVATGAATGLALLAIVTLLFLPTELTWSTRAMIEPELFPTKTRGRWVSYARTVVWIVAGVITMLLSLYFYPTAPSQFMYMFNVSSAIVMVVFLLGLLASVAWYYKGFETAGKSLAGHDAKA